ncbi:hypothetical protein [Geobacillus sp. ZGt-1]|uniref:hypothetical protein n=1 Tax=Geobacillus sp. ZGt-1 TaxID=1631556 RepID=UPI001F3F2767|nr:hypothetical protein [Geobacillus sp. ZGt-1]
MDERLDAASVFLFVKNYNLIRFMYYTKTKTMMLIGGGGGIFCSIIPGGTKIYCKKY